MSDRLRLTIGRNDFTLTMMRKSVVSVRPIGLVMLSSRGYKFHTHTPKSLLPYSVVIEGLSSDVSEGEVTNFLLTETSVSMEIVGITNIAEDK